MMLWKLHNSGLAGPADATGEHPGEAKEPSWQSPLGVALMAQNVRPLAYRNESLQ